MELGTLSFISRYQKSTYMPAEIRFLEGVHSPFELVAEASELWI